MPFTADEFHDLIRLVEAHPEWRAELRRLVLTDELLALPEQVGAWTREVTELVTIQLGRGIRKAQAGASLRVDEHASKT